MFSVILWYLFVLLHSFLVSFPETRLRALKYTLADLIVVCEFNLFPVCFPASSVGSHSSPTGTTWLSLPSRPSAFRPERWAVAPFCFFALFNEGFFFFFLPWGWVGWGVQEVTKKSTCNHSTHPARHNKDVLHGNSCDGHKRFSRFCANGFV